MTAGIIAFLDAAERQIQHLHSLIVLRRGAVVAEGYWHPYAADQPHMLFSLSKSFTSTAIGMLVAAGKLTLEDRVLDFFPDEAPAAPSANLRAMRVKHLLTMNTGHDADPTRTLRQAGPEWRRTFLALPVEHEPGTHFVYNSLATYMLSAIAQRLSGQRLVDYLGPRLFEPLGMGSPVWETSPEGIDAGGWGLSARTIDIARFGQLYLQGGVWEGQRLLSAEWVAEATGWRVPNSSENPDWAQGYGYQFWRCRHGAYRGDGAFGQFCVVVPEQEAVVAITAGVGKMQSVLDLVWEHLLPAMGSDSRPEDSAALAERLAGLRLPTVAGNATSPRAAAFSGREYSVAENEDGITSILFDFRPEGATRTLRRQQGDQVMRFGYGEWVLGEADGEPVAASGAWRDDQTYVADVWRYRTPFRHRLTCHFTADRVRVDREVNVAFGPTELPRLEGRAAAGDERLRPPPAARRA